ncbi:MAG: cysteine desulfurase [Treponema sp.]|nr:cysteine desulfurase [Treponema sp.]
MADTRFYFDWAATAPLDEAIVHAALSALRDAWGNPSSQHADGRCAYELLAVAREQAAAALGVPAAHLYFTSGGTESNHIPLLSVLNRPHSGTVLISSIEHPSLREMARSLEAVGWQVTLIPATHDGTVTADAVQAALTDDTVLVCVMAVNNETGAVQPIADIANTLRSSARGKRRAKLHVDAVQAAGKIPLDTVLPYADSAAFSAHKIAGPRGIGALYVADTFEPFLRGGGQEHGVRSGTENVFGATALAACLERYCITKQNDIATECFHRQRTATAHFIERLRSLPSCAIVPSCRAPDDARFSPWIVQAAFKNIPGQVLVRALDTAGFSISTGSACSTRKQNRPVLQAMHVPPDIQNAAVRFSFGPQTTHRDMDALFAAVKTVVEQFS